VSWMPSPNSLVDPDGPVGIMDALALSATGSLTSTSCLEIVKSAMGGSLPFCAGKTDASGGEDGHEE